MAHGFSVHRARQLWLEECLQRVLEEAEMSTVTITLFQAALRLQGRARAGGLIIGFDQALYRVRRRDKAGVFVR